MGVGLASLGACLRFELGRLRAELGGSGHRVCCHVGVGVRREQVQPTMPGTARQGLTAPQNARQWIEADASAASSTHGPSGQKSAS